jgi:Ca-activated chloride channel family protein
MLLLLYALIPAIILIIVNYKWRFTRIYSLLTSISTIFYEDMDTGSGKKRYILPVRFELGLRYTVSSLFFIIFFICICIALAGPRFGIHFTRELRQGTDIALAFDLSRSMNVKDSAPLPSTSAPEIPSLLPAPSETAARGALSSSRLERSVYTARSLLENLISADGYLNNIRIAAAIGKGEAVLAVPLTDDPEAIFALLDSLNSLAITSRGTNLEKILDAAAGAFQDNFPSSRLVILFSDGEVVSGSIPAAIERLRQRDIKIYSVGAGSIYGAAVPPETANSSVAHQPSVISYLKPDVLTAAAEAAGGVFIDGNSSNAAAQIVTQIKSGGITASNDGAWTFREEISAQWHIFVITGLAAFIISKLCSLRLRKRFEPVTKPLRKH